MLFRSTRSSRRTRVGQKSHGRKAEIILYSIQERRPSLVRLPELEDDLSQENETKKRRTIRNHRSPRTGNLQIKTSEHLANPRRIPRNPTQTIQGKRDLWRNLFKSPTRTARQGRGIRCRDDPESSKTRMRLSILCEMAGLSNL